MALFKKPNNLKYTDMCIYVDNNVYRDDLSEVEVNLIFEYLYHIAKMLAYKSEYFKNNDYYDDFAVYFASVVYFRLRNPKQFQIDPETGEPKLTKVKSCLNYMKNVGYLRKIEFEQEFYSQVLSPSFDADEQVAYDTNYSFADRLSETIEDISLTDFDLCLSDICRTAKNFLKDIPYKNDPVLWNNIYLSCMLTLLNTLILPNKALRHIASLKYDIRNRPRALANMYKDTPDKLTILYHVDKSLKDYIWILTQEIKHLVAKDLSLSLHTYVPVSSSLNAIAMADINIEEYLDYGE